MKSFTSLSGLVAHSRDSKGDLDMMVALVCMMGLKDHTLGDRGKVLKLVWSEFPFSEVRHP